MPPPPPPPFRSSVMPLIFNPSLLCFSWNPICRRCFHITHPPLHPPVLTLYFCELHRPPPSPSYSLQCPWFRYCRNVNSEAGFCVRGYVPPPTPTALSTLPTRLFALPLHFFIRSLLNNRLPTPFSFSSLPWRESIPVQRVIHWAKGRMLQATTAMSHTTSSTSWSLFWGPARISCSPGGRT